MATFTTGNAYKFIGNNLPENQCVTYSMFEVYDVPVTAYNITVNIYLQGPSYLTLRDVSPDNSQSPHSCGYIHILPVNIATNMPIESLDTDYYDFIENRNAFALNYKEWNWTNTSNNWYDITDGIVLKNVCNYVDDYLLQTYGLGFSTWDNNGESEYSLPFGANDNTLICKLNILNVSASTMVFNEKFELQMYDNSYDEKYDTAGIYTGRFNENYNAPDNTPYFRITFNAATMDLSVYSDGHFHSTVNKTIVEDTTSNGVNTKQVDFAIMNPYFYAEYDSSWLGHYNQ